MSDTCSHIDSIHTVTPGSKGCEECLKLGWEWFHLRLCRTCGHVGCCDQSRGKHGTKHFHHTQHPIIEGYDPPEGWGWCFVDEIMFDLGDDVTPQVGPIPVIIDLREKETGMETIQEGFDVFIHDGSKAFGAVRQIRSGEIVVYVENAGDFEVPLSAVKDVHDEKVVLDSSHLGAGLKEAIRRAHGGEDPRIP